MLRKLLVFLVLLAIGIASGVPGEATEWKTHTLAHLTLELPEGWFRVFGGNTSDLGGFIRPLWEGKPPEGEQIFQNADILAVLSGEYAAGPIEELKQSGAPFTEEPIIIGSVTTSLYRAEAMGKEAFMVFLEGPKLGVGLFLEKGSTEARKILESITIGAFPYPLFRLLGQEVLDCPQGVACDPEGQVYVVNHSRHQVVVFGADGTLLFTFGEEGSEPGKLFYPAGVALDLEGYLYVTDGVNRIQKFDRKGSAVSMTGEERRWMEVLPPPVPSEFARELQGMAPSLGTPQRVENRGKVLVEARVKGDTVEGKRILEGYPTPQSFTGKKEKEP